GVAVKGRGAAFAVPVLAVHLAEGGFPEQIAAGVEAVEAVRAEEREDVLAVGDGRRRGEAGRDLPGLMRQGLVYRLLPEYLPGLAADGQDREFVALGHAQIVMGAGAHEAGLDGIAVGDRRGQEEAVAPDDRRGMPLARQRDLPAEVLGL